MQNLCQLGVREAKLPATDSRHTSNVASTSGFENVFDDLFPAVSDHNSRNRQSIQPVPTQTPSPQGYPIMSLGSNRWDDGPHLKCKETTST
jgi:hypothetical protein